MEENRTYVSSIGLPQGGCGPPLIFKQSPPDYHAYPGYKTVMGRHQEPMSIDWGGLSAPITGADPNSLKISTPLAPCMMRAAPSR